MDENLSKKNRKHFVTILVGFKVLFVHGKKYVHVWELYELDTAFSLVRINVIRRENRWLNGRMGFI